MNLFDGVLYVNLAHRTDRLASITQELTENPIAKKFISPDKIHRIDACYDKNNGAIGCGKSHCKALQMALDNGWNRVMILEDDFIWNTDTNYVIEQFQQFSQFDSVGLSWDVLLLSTNQTILDIIPDNCPSFINRVCKALTTGGYIINGQCNMHKILEAFNVAINNMESGKPRDQNAIDIHWQPLQRADKWYAFKPHNVGTQYPSYSDVLGIETNYTAELI